MLLSLWGRDELYDEAIYSYLAQMAWSCPCEHASAGNRPWTLSTQRRQNKLQQNCAVIHPPTIRREPPKL